MHAGGIIACFSGLCNFRHQAHVYLTRIDRLPVSTDRLTEITIVIIHYCLHVRKKEE